MTDRRAGASPTVAIIAHSLNLETGGGSNHSLHQLACGLSEAGCRVKVITLAPRLNRVKADTPYEVVEHRLSDSFLSTPRQLWLTALMFRWQRGVDLFHIEAPSLVMAAGLYRTLGGRTPVVARLHSYSWFCTNVARMNATCFQTCSRLDRIRHRDENVVRKVLLAPVRLAADVLRRSVMKRLDGVASVSEPASAIEQYRGLVASHHTTLPPIVGESVNTNGNGPAKGVADPVRYLYVGRMTREKGVDVLLRATSGLRSPVHLDLVGDGPEMRALVDLANQLGITNEVTFHGWLSQQQVRDFYARASVFVHPGRWPEPSGRSVVDALASGLPVIVSDTGGPPWIAGEAGLTFHAEDHDDLRRKIEALSSDPALRQQLAGVARSRVSGFRQEEILSRLLGVYADVAPAFDEQTGSQS